MSNETDGCCNGVMASEVPQRVNNVLAEAAPELFMDFDQTPDEERLRTRLIQPLEATWSANEIYSVLQESPTASNFCGKVFKNGEPAIFCK